MIRIACILFELFTSNRLVRAVAIASIGLLLVIAAVPSACASIQSSPVQESFWTGQSRTTTGGNGLTGNGTYYDGGFQIEWHITHDPNGTYHYQYTFSGNALEANQGGISHFTLDVSDDAIKGDTLADGVIKGDTLADGVIIDPKLGSTTISAGKIEAGNKDFIVGAVKFDLGGDADSLIYEFDSKRKPVWGSFLVKGGGGPLPNELTTTSSSGTAYVANDGLFELNDLDDDNWNFNLGSKQNWIAVPNGDHHATPEPATVVIWCVFAVFGIALSRWRRR